jgi:peptidoglycan/LPS O-acetylase OafA/YrhL
VELFFVISGFVLPYALHRGAYRLRDYGTFWAKRIIRLEPPYLASLALALGLWLLAAQFAAYKGPAFIVEWPRVLLHLGYLNHYFSKESYNPVYWTLAIELQFYLSIAFLFPLLLHPRRRVRLAVPAALLALAWIPGGEFTLFKYLPLFVWGIVTFQFQAGQISWREWATFLLLAGACAFRLLQAPATLAGALAVAAMAGAARPRAAAFLAGSRTLRVLAWAGRLSYSLYLIHVPVGGKIINLGARLHGGSPTRLGVLAGAVSATLLAAWLLNRFIEKPSQRWSGSLDFSRVRP